jgi:hypothetical protein
MNIEFKFSINDRVTAFDGREGTIEALCYGEKGIFYRARIKNSYGLIDTHKNYFESELVLGWETYQHERK